MLLPDRIDEIRTLRVHTDGRVVPEDPLRLRNTLFAHAHGAEHAALVRLTPPEERSFDGMAARLRLLHAIKSGVRGMQLVGSGHGLRDGKVYAASDTVSGDVLRRFETAEDALAYGGLLFSEAQTVLRLETARVTSRGDGDGQGWIDAQVLRDHELPVRQIQVRALFGDALAKGTLLPVEGLTEREGVQVLLHTTQLKGAGRDVSGEFLVAVRDVAQPRTMRSSWTWTQFLDETEQDELFERHGEAALAATRRALESNDSALAFLGALQVHGDEEAERRDLLTAYLSAGLSPRHPWVHRRLLELVRRTYLDAALGLGPVPLHSGMACCADDERLKHEVTVPWLSEGPLTILRYPVRDGQSLRLVRNVHRDAVPRGSIAVHPDLLAELDGDVDGDWLAVTEDATVARGVRRLHRRGLPRLPIPPRTRRRSPPDALARVAVDSLGASGIGTPTWLVAACVEGDRRDLVPRLSLELQVATMGLKWNVERDYDVIREAGRRVALPEWLELQRDRDVFTTKAPRVPDIGLGRFWNRAAQHFEEVAAPSTGMLGTYLDVVPLPAGDADLLAEVESVRQTFNRRIAQSGGDLDEIRGALDAVRSWAAGKTGDCRREFARTAWYLTHRSPSPRSSGSFAIHAFPDVLVEEIQAGTGYRAPTINGRGTETVEGRPCSRSDVAPEFPVETRQATTHALRLVGGWRALVDLYGVTRDEALAHLARVVSTAELDTDPIRLSWVDAPWNGHRVLRANLGDDPLGYVPEDRAETLPEEITGEHAAYLLLRGRTVHATLIG